MECAEVEGLPVPILMLIVTPLGGALWWWVRSNPRDAVNTAADVVTTVRNAPRRLAFRKQTNAHPVEGIDDVRIAICGIAQSFIELDDLPTKEDRDKLHLLLRTMLQATEAEAEEMEVLGRWLMTQCNGPKAAIPRLARRMAKIDGDASYGLLQDMLMALVGDELSSAQTDAISDIRLAFHKKI